MIDTRTILVITIGLIQGPALSTKASAAGDIIGVSPEEQAWSLFQEVNTVNSEESSDRLEWETWASTRALYANPDQEPLWDEAIMEERFPLFIRMRREKFKEIRINRRSFDYVAENELYFLEGQMQKHRQKEAIVFPDRSCHVSALWQLIDGDEAATYHSVEVDCPDGGRQVWGMASMHIALKKSDEWLWTTWEHRSNPNLSLAAETFDYFPDALAGSIWQNYALVGTQTGFTDDFGKPTLLANSELEIGFERNSSSCMTCHSRASVSDRYGDLRLPVLESHDPRRGSVGEPDPEWFYESNELGERLELKYTQTDFVWSLKRASSRAKSAKVE